MGAWDEEIGRVGEEDMRSTHGTRHRQTDTYTPTHTRHRHTALDTHIPLLQVRESHPVSSVRVSCVRTVVNSDGPTSSTRSVPLARPSSPRPLEVPPLRRVSWWRSCKSGGRGGGGEG